MGEGRASGSREDWAIRRIGPAFADAEVEMRAALERSCAGAAGVSGLLLGLESCRRRSRIVAAIPGRYRRRPSLAWSIEELARVGVTTSIEFPDLADRAISRRVRPRGKGSLVTEAGMSIADARELVGSGARMNQAGTSYGLNWSPTRSAHYLAIL